MEEGRPRRRLYRRRRRFKRRRRRRPKIKLTQWQPSSVKRAFIIGYFPAIICGPGRWSENFTSHIEDKIAIGSYGGGHSTSRWSLKSAVRGVPKAPQLLDAQQQRARPSEVLWQHLDILQTRGHRLHSHIQQKGSTGRQHTDSPKPAPWGSHAN